MLRSLSLCLILMLLISACSGPRQAKPTTYPSAHSSVQDPIQYPTQYPGKPKSLALQPRSSELQIKSHWEMSYFDEPVFNSNVAVLEAGSKDNPSIILIHGLGNLGMKDWFTVIPELEQNYHVIAMDLPGFGLSSSAKGRFLPTNYADVIAAISEQYASGKTIAIGHSMGGAVALRYTELYQNRVNQLILVDVAGLLEKSAFIKHIASFEKGEKLSTPMKILIEGVNDISSSLIETGTKSTFISDFLQENDHAWDFVVSDSANMNAALSLVEEDFNEAINQVLVPVNIIWGEKDNVAPLRTGKVLNKKLRNAQLQVISGAGHVPMKSHHKEFMGYLTDALNNNKSQIIKQQLSLVKAGINQGLLTCLKERGKTYTGYYEKIVIESCDQIQLLNVTTNNLIITGSVVEIENLTYENDDHWMEFNGSEVTITNADIAGHIPMLLNGSSVYMAGVSFKSTGDAVMIGMGSRVSASFCDIESPSYSGIVHGAFHRSHEPLMKSKAGQ